MMFLRLDDYTVPGFGLRVSGAFQLKKADASGETSSTTKADKGTKGKTLTVTTQIRYQDEADLRELIRISEAKGSGESGKVYTITNTTANAAGIRQVIFADRVSWDEQEGGGAGTCLLPWLNTSPSRSGRKRGRRINRLRRRHRRRQPGKGLSRRRSRPRRKWAGFTSCSKRRTTPSGDYE